MDAIRANRGSSDENPFVIMDGLGLLGDLHDTSIIDDLVEFLNDEQDYIREHTLETLITLQDPCSIPFIIPLLQDEDKYIRQRAKWAIDYIKQANFSSDSADTIQ